MGKRVTPTCDMCGNDVQPDPRGGDEQGGPHTIGFPQRTVRLVLCSPCAAPLRRFADVVQAETGGVVQGSASLTYLPWADDPTTQPTPPKFTA